MTFDHQTWWVSWECYEDDYRIVEWPLPKEIIKYWCSGTFDGGVNLVAWMDCKEEDIDVIIKRCWPDHNGEFRFKNPREPGFTPGDRFPL